MSKCFTKCEFDNIDVLYIPRRIIGNGFWIKGRDFERSFYTGTLIDAVDSGEEEMFSSTEDSMKVWLVLKIGTSIGKKVNCVELELQIPYFFTMKTLFELKEDTWQKKIVLFTAGISNYKKKWGINGF